MKIIFLDIDGVLNSSQFYENKENQQFLEEPFDIACALRLKRITDATGAVIVLTSSWRGGWEKNPADCTLEGKLLNELFESVGISVYDKTEVLSSGRAQEIKQYLNSCKEKVERYVIIDDNDFEWRKNRLSRHVVLTDFMDGGLLDTHADKAISLLNKKWFL